MRLCACGAQSFGPWPQRHAWQEWQRTRSTRFISEDSEYMHCRITYGGILGLLSVAALECNTVALVLQALRSNEALDLWCLSVWLLALTLWLNLTTNDELADLETTFH